MDTTARAGSAPGSNRYARIRFANYTGTTSDPYLYIETAPDGSDGSSAGTSTAPGQGAADTRVDGSSAGVATAPGQGADDWRVTGTAAGAAVVAGVGAETITTIPVDLEGEVQTSPALNGQVKDVSLAGKTRAISLTGRVEH